MNRTTGLVFTAAAFTYFASSSGAIGDLRVFAANATEVARPDAVTTAVVRATQTATGQAIDIPAHPEIIVSLTTIPVSGATRVHKHPYQRYVYVLAGLLKVTDMTTGKSNTYKPGTFVAEMRGTYHFGANVGADEVKLLVIDQVPPGTASNVVMQTDEP